jgi:hypothetical protein
MEVNNVCDSENPRCQPTYWDVSARTAWTMFVRSGGPLDTVSGPWCLWLPQVKVDAIHYIHHPSPRRNLGPFSGQAPGKYISRANILAQFARTSKAETASNKVKPSCFTNSPVFKADEATMNRTVTSSATIGDLGVILIRTFATRFAGSWRSSRLTPLGWCWCDPSRSHIKHAVCRSQRLHVLGVKTFGLAFLAGLWRESVCLVENLSCMKCYMGSVLGNSNAHPKSELQFSSLCWSNKRATLQRSHRRSSWIHSIFLWLKHSVISIQFPRYRHVAKSCTPPFEQRSFPTFEIVATYHIRKHIRLLR